jgi:L-seryl-tRNA(Ser) seleniumtransferase
MKKPTVTNSLLRSLPGIDKLLQSPQFASVKNQIPHAILLEAAQTTVDACRNGIRNNSTDRPQTADPNTIAQQAIVLAWQLNRPRLRPVINATGTLLHTNLGRAPLADAALKAVDAVARSYSNLELNLESGKRGSRFSHVEKLICQLTGAEAATVVNNNAGAVMLSLAALAFGKEAIVSRGELVEIGGSFRIPEVMEASGVGLREVGSTNKTHLKDYVSAINGKTGLLLKVHTSNYRILGFSEDVSGAKLVELGCEHNLPVMEDLGSGMLFDMTPYGLPREPTVAETIAAGIDIVTFSGDKLLGGPQAGIIAGRREAVERIRKHPMARALRCDKMTLAGLEATLRLYLDPLRAKSEIPLLKMLSTTAAETKLRAGEIVSQLNSTLGDQMECSVVEETATVGGGALPLSELVGFAVAIRPKTISVDQLSMRLRRGRPPVISRIQDGTLRLNPRTIRPDEETLLMHTITAAVAESEPAGR